MNDLVSFTEKNASVFYRVVPKSFFDSDGDGIGDLRGMLAKIPYFLYLGVDSIVLNDIVETDRHGATDFFRVDPELGSTEDFEALVGGLHSANLKVYLSLPLLYTSTEHPWFEKSRQGGDLNPYREYYVWKAGKDSKGKTPPDDRKTRTKDSVWAYEKNEWWYDAYYGADRPTLNYDNPRVRKEMSDAMRFWREKGVDGFFIENARFALVPSVVESKNDYIHFTERLEIGAPLYRFLREMEEKFSHEFPVYLDSDGIDPDVIPYLMPEGSPIVDGIVSEQPIEEADVKSFSLRKFLKKYIALQSSVGALSLFMRFGDPVHDRIVSKIARPTELADAAKMLGALLVTAVPVPVIYQGEELGMTDLSKKYLAEKEGEHFCPNARLAFQWDNKTNAGFTLAPYSVLPVNGNYREINCSTEWADPDSVLSFYRRLVAMRKNSPALCEGAFTDYSDGDVIAFTRDAQEDRLLILANTIARHMNYSLPPAVLSSGAECLLSSYSLVGKTLHSSIGLRPYEVRIYRLK